MSGRRRPDGLLWRQPELLQQAELVQAPPSFDDFPVGDSEDVDPAEDDLASSGGLTHNGCAVGAVGGEFLGHEIALGDQLLLVPIDAVFFATADPATLLVTGAFAEDPLTAATEQFLHNEFGHDDVNKFQSLATGDRHVATLDAATGGQRTASARYCEIMSPLGLGDELSVTSPSSSSRPAPATSRRSCSARGDSSPANATSRSSCCAAHPLERSWQNCTCPRTP